MNQEIMLMVIEVVIGIVVEGVILSMVFAFIANTTSEKQNQALKGEMNNIEQQTKFQFEQALKTIQEAKLEIISQVKEANYNKGGK